MSSMCHSLRSTSPDDTRFEQREGAGSFGSTSGESHEPATASRPRHLKQEGDVTTLLVVTKEAIIRPKTEPFGATT